MALSPTPALSRYSAVAITLHWLIALLILGNIVLAWTFQNTPQGLLWFNLIQLHKSVGITVLVLSLARLGWRLLNPPPPEPATLQPWEHIASRVVHWGFYVIMLGMPLSGWVLVSASTKGLPTLLYGKIPWPHIGPVHALPLDARKVWSGNAANTHEVLAWLAYLLIVLHVGAALKHWLIDRDTVIGRMVPFLSRGAR